MLGSWAVVNLVSKLFLQAVWQLLLLSWSFPPIHSHEFTSWTSGYIHNCTTQTDISKYDYFAWVLYNLCGIVLYIDGHITLPRRNDKKLHVHNSRSVSDSCATPPYLISLIWIHFPELWGAVDMELFYGGYLKHASKIPIKAELYLWGLNTLQHQHVVILLVCLHLPKRFFLHVWSSCS